MDEKEVSEMQEEMMTVLVVEPMKAPYVKHIPNELEDLQQAVGQPPACSVPFPRRNTGIVPGVRGQMRNSKIKKKSMKKCVVDIRYHAAVGDYSRILVVLTSHQGERTDGRNKKKWNEQGSILESD